MELRKIIGVLLLASASGVIHAYPAAGRVVEITQQQASVKGVVVDASGPVVGATVLVKGTTRGTITDIDGNFALDVASGETLEVSYIGYLSQTIKYTGQKDLRVTLKEDTQTIDEVVVVGFGTQKKVNVTGSVANIDNKLFESRPITNVSSGLQGLLPGVTVTQSSGQPGKDTGTIRVRGTGTLNSADPMVIVDGVESTMNDIDSNDIQSISVLKDAASSAIYGSKAANGVILITTKRGKAGKSSVSYAANFGFTKATSLPEFFSSGQMAEYWNNALEYEGSPKMFKDDEIRKFYDGSDPVNYANTNWQDKVYKNAFQHTHNVNVNGGSETARYMASVGYQGQNGIIDNFDKKQYNIRLNLDLNPVKNLETNFSLAYTRQDVNNPVSSYGDFDVYDILRLVNRISPMVVGKYDDGTYGAVSDGNPLAWIESGANTRTNTHNLMAVASAKYYFLPYLSLKAQAAYKMQLEDKDTFNKKIQYNATYSQGTTYKEVTNTNYDRISADILPEFKKSFGQHNVNVLLGFHTELYKHKKTYAYRKGFPNTEVTDLDAGSAATAKAEGVSRDLAMLSYFGRINYDYAGKYLFEFNVRRDGSSRFSTDNRWGTFPSVSAGWRISEEGFFDGLRETVNNLKLRGSWGKLGNQEVLDSDGNPVYYPTISTMTLGKDYPLGGALASGAHTFNAVNPDLKWEETTTWGVAADLTLLNKVNITAEYYNKTTSGILMEMSTSAIFALNKYYANLAEIRNSGVELSIDYNDRFGEVGFNFGGNVAFNQSDVLNIGGKKYELSPENDCYTAVNWIGHAMNSYYGYETDGIFQDEKEMAAWPEYTFTGKTRRLGDIKYKDVDGDGEVTADDRTVQGSMDPKITFGFHLGVNYKNFDLIAFFQGAGGVYRYISEGLGNLSSSTSKPNALWLDSWTPTNTDAKYPRLASPGNEISMEYSDFWLQNSSYLRMKDLQIGYTFPKAALDKVGIEKLRVYYSGQNLFTLSGMLKGWDPEAPSGRGNGFPQTMVNSIGLNVTF